MKAIYGGVFAVGLGVLPVLVRTGHVAGSLTLICAVVACVGAVIALSGLLVPRRAPHGPACRAVLVVVLAATVS